MSNTYTPRGNNASPVTLRDYQQGVVDKCYKYFATTETTPKAFLLSLFVGTGKTVTAIRTSELILPRLLPNQSKFNVIVAVPTNELRDQFMIEIERFASDTRITWAAYTYQSLRTLKIPDTSMLIIDEAHQGGLDKGMGTGSYRTIIKKLAPKFVLGLTATGYGLDEKIFGERTGENTFVYTMKQASEEGFLAPCQLVTIHTGLSQELIDGQEIEGEDIHEVTSQQKEKGADVRCDESQKVLQEALLGATIETYVVHERGNQALVYVANCAAADRGTKMFNDAVQAAGLGALQARAVHSKTGTSQQDIADFRRDAYKVMFTCRQLQEGFNMPSLKVAFDTCPSTSNNGRVFKQRAGRPLRPYEGEVARYYVLIGSAPTRYSLENLTDNDNYANAEPEEQEALDQHVNMHANLVKTFCEDGDDAEALTVAIPNTVKTDKDDITQALDAHFYPEGKPGRRTRLTSSQLFITKAGGHRTVDTVTLRDLLKAGVPDSDGKKKELLEMARRGDPRPSQNTSLGKALSNYVTYNGGSFDEEFTNQIKKLVPGWFLTRVTTTNDDILAFIRREGRRPSHRSKDAEERRLGGTLRNRISLSSRGHDPDFRSQVEELVPKGESAKRHEKPIIGTPIDGGAPLYFESVAQAKRAGFSGADHVLSGRNKTSNGYTFRYLTKEEWEDYSSKKQDD